MKSLKQYGINIVVIISITLIALYFSMKDNFADIMQAILQMNPFMLVLCLSWGILMTAVWGYSYTVIAKRFKKDYSFKDGVVNAFVGTFFNGITPSATGGQFAQAYVLHKQGISYGDGVSILWADFIIYQTSLMIYVTVLFLIRFKYYVDVNAWFWIVGIGYLINLAVVIGLYTIALFPEFYSRLAEKGAVLLEKLHLIKNSSERAKQWNKQVREFTYESRKLSRDVPLIIKVFLINLVRLTVYFALPYIIARGMALHVPARDFIDTLALSSFVVMANSFVPLPGASGGTEVIFQMLFYPIFGTLCTAVMLIWRLSSYYVIVIIGALVFIVFKSHHDMQEEKPPLPKTPDQDPAIILEDP